MSTQEIKKAIHEVIDEIPEPALNDILQYLKHVKEDVGIIEKYLPLDYSKYQFETKDLKFNREDMHER